MSNNSVFISWSGPNSRKVAAALREWVKSVVQPASPWMSEVDIDTGARWQAEIALKLSNTDVGIICLTRDNLTSSWLLFEAGALSKTLTDANRVIPYLHGMELSQITGPLTQFQAVKADKDGTKRLVSTINGALGASAVEQVYLDKAFERAWPELEAQLQAIPTANDPGTSPPLRPEREMLEELLELTRVLNREMISSSLGRNTSVFPSASASMSPSGTHVSDKNRIELTELQLDSSVRNQWKKFIAFVAQEDMASAALIRSCEVMWDDALGIHISATGFVVTKLKTDEKILASIARIASEAIRPSIRLHFYVDTKEVLQIPPSESTFDDETEKTL